MLKVIFVNSGNEIKAPKPSSRNRIDAFKRDFIIKHNLKFKSLQNGSY